MGSYTFLWATVPCPNHLSDRYQMTWDSLYTPQPMKLFKPANLNPANPASPILSLETTI